MRLLTWHGARMRADDLRVCVRTGEDGELFAGVVSDDANLKTNRSRLLQTDE
jgi:hypothetical protein